jgi:NAD(P)-dependent dehydrogenase (short-subunit alcohol dehydrogenase family)
MELAPLGVRVNTVHPDAVFDTGVWTDDILEARAAKYNMSVESYKKRNLLKASITSKDVARTIFLLVGSEMSATTGAHVSIDGGERPHCIKVDLRCCILCVPLFRKVRIQEYPSLFYPSCTL